MESGLDIATRIRSTARSGLACLSSHCGGEALARALGHERPDEAARDDQEDRAAQHRLVEEPELVADEGRREDGRRVVDREAEEHVPLVLRVAQEAARPARREPLGRDVEGDHGEGHAEGAEAPEDGRRVGEHADIHHEERHEEGVAHELDAVHEDAGLGDEAVEEEAGDEGADYRLEPREARGEGADEDEGYDEDEFDRAVGLDLAEEELRRLRHEDSGEDGPDEDGAEHLGPGEPAAAVVRGAGYRGEDSHRGRVGEDDRAHRDDHRALARHAPAWRRWDRARACTTRRGSRRGGPRGSRARRGSCPSRSLPRRAGRR
jgi:hypothetical protein